MWLFLLAARHRMQALSALTCSVGSGLKACASLDLCFLFNPNRTECKLYESGLPLSFLFFLKGSSVYSETSIVLDKE